MRVKFEPQWDRRTDMVRRPSPWRWIEAMKFEGKLEGLEIAPREPRTDIAYDVLVRCEDGEFEAEILNVSAMGFGLRSSVALEVGSNVTLSVAELPGIKAVIRWTRGLDAGGVFADPVAL